MVMTYKTTSPLLDPNPPNVITGRALVQGVNFRKELICFDDAADESSCSGRCAVIVRKKDQDELTRTHFVTVSVKLGLIYANVSRLNATGAHCVDLRLPEFKSANDPAENSTSESSMLAMVTQLDQQYAKVSC